MKNVLSILLLLAAGFTAAGQGTYSIGLSEVDGALLVTINRSGDIDVREVVSYNTVSLSALAGVHFTKQTGTFTFEPGDTKKQFAVPETAVGEIDAPYCLQAGTLRDYRIEVTDPGGFVLASKTRRLEYGSAYQYRHKYANKDLTDFVYMSYYKHTTDTGIGYVDIPYTPSASEVETSGTLTGYVMIDDSYDYSRKAASVSTDAVIEGTVSKTRDYLAAIGTKMYATVCFNAKESYDGYAYVQVLTGDRSAAYDTGYDPDAKVNNPVNSIYKACFELKYGNSVSSSNYNFIFPHRYDYRTREVGINAGKYLDNHSDFGDDDNYLYEQKFKSGYRASDAASFILDPTVTDLTVRFDCGGSGDDTFGYKDLVVRAALLDTQAPQLVDIKVSPGNYAPGNPFYISLVFNELVQAGITDKYAVFGTSWGPVYYASGDNTNILTYSGTIKVNSTPGTVLTINNLDSLPGYPELGLTDMAGNLFNGPVVRTFNDIVTSEEYVYNLSYVLNGGTLPKGYNTGYCYSTGIKLPVPEQEGKLFLGWFDNPQLTGTAYFSLPHFTTGDKTLYAKWDMDFAYGKAGTEDDPYLVSTPHEMDLFVISVNNGNTYKNKIIKLTDDITYTHGNDASENNYTIIYDYGDFQGTFDGDGHTIRGIRINIPDETNVGLFGDLRGVIKNLKLADTRINGLSQVGGLVGRNQGDVINCSVANDVYITADEFCGGLVGLNYKSVSGCLSMARLQGREYKKSGYGGIAGINDEGTVDNCFVINAVIPSTAQSGAIVGDIVSGASLNNNYYRNCKLDNTINTGFGCKGSDTNGARCARAITAESGITAIPTATATVFSTSGITFYGNTSACYDGKLYSLAGLDLALSLSHDPAPDGYIFTGYKASEGNLSGNDTDGYALAMPDADVTISGYEVDLSLLWGAESDGTEAHPYIISDVEGWNQLSQEVAAGRSFSGQYFRMGADFGPVTATVGTEITPFAGIFNGNGHTLTVSLTENDIRYYAPFHYIDGATFQSLRVAGSIHSNKANAGGIVGYIAGETVLIEDCVSSVTITSAVTSGNGENGGLAGFKEAGCAITFLRCVFDGQLVKDGSYGRSYHGGILGGVGDKTTPNKLFFTNCLVVPSKFDLSMRSALAAGSVYYTTTDCYCANDLYGNTYDYSKQDCHQIFRVTLSEGLYAIRSNGIAIAGGAGYLYPDGASWAGTEYYASGATVELGSQTGYSIRSIEYYDDHSCLILGGGEQVSIPMPSCDITLTASITVETSIQITANQATFAGQTHYWTTFYHNLWNYRLPKGAQAFTMKDDKTLYRVGDGSIIPAGCPVVIMADSASLTLTVTEESATPESGNILQGSLGDSFLDVHVLSLVNGVIGFYKYSGFIPANKAYYEE